MTQNMTQNMTQSMTTIKNHLRIIVSGSFSTRKLISRVARPGFEPGTSGL